MRLLRYRFLAILLAIPLLFMAAGGASAQACSAIDDAGHCCDQLSGCGPVCTGTCQSFSAIENVAVPIWLQSVSTMVLTAADGLLGIKPAPELPPPR